MRYCVKSLDSTEQNLRAIGLLHVDLATTLEQMGLYADARHEYEVGLTSAKDVSDDRGQAVVLGQLGTLAMNQSDLNAARKLYLEALGLFKRMGEDQAEATVWHQLGMVAQKAREWDEAERCYKESVAIDENIDDFQGAARTCNQLATVAESVERPQEAERWYLWAIELFEKVTDTQNLAKGLSNLAGLYLTQNRIDEANAYARRALAIKETLDLSSEPWATYSILAQIAEKRGHKDEVREWRRKDQEGQGVTLSQLLELVERAAAGGDKELGGQLFTAFQQMSRAEDSTSSALGNVLLRVLVGEREPDLSKLPDEVASAVRGLLSRLKNK
jgi:tetratricopeptide (TPR) repeat protein